MPRSPLVRIVIVAGALLALLALYWSTVSYHYGGDGLLFAGSVEAVRAGNHSTVTLLVFFHAHHVLYGPFGLLAHLPWDPATPAVTTMAMGNGALAVLTCVVFFLLCRRLGAAVTGAFLATATLALSFVFWLFAVHAETYMLAQFGSIAFLWLVVRDRGPDPGAGLGASAVAPSLMWALAIGGHIANVLLVIPLALNGWKRRPAKMFAIVAGGGVATLLVYLVAMRWTEAPWTFSGLIDWIRPQGDYVDASVGGAGATLVALAQSVGPGPVGSPWTAPWIGLVLVGVVIVVFRGEPTSHEPATAMLVGWFVTYVVFFSLWDSGNVEFSLWLLVPLLAALALGEARVRPQRKLAVRGLWVLVIAFMALTNFTREIGPHRDPATNSYLQVTYEIGPAMAEPDRLMISGAGPSSRYKFYLPYFFGRTTYNLIDRYRALGEEGLKAELAAMRNSIRRGERIVYGLPELFGEEGIGEMQAAGMPDTIVYGLRQEFRAVGTLSLATGETLVLTGWSPE